MLLVFWRRFSPMRSWLHAHHRTPVLLTVEVRVDQSARQGDTTGKACRAATISIPHRYLRIPEQSFM
jgi:hypothetical protein